MIITGLRKEKAEQIKYIFRNWLDQIVINECNDDSELYNVNFFECPYIMRCSSTNAIVIELGANYISLDRSDFIVMKIF